MAKIAVTSDLHLGITAPRSIQMLAEEMAAAQPDLTVLAGDLGEPLPYFTQCLNLFGAMPGHVAVLAGNHDVWNQGCTSQALWEEHLPRVTQSAGMLWLEGHIWRKDDIAVVGSIAWYDYSAVDATIPPYPPDYFAREKHRYNNDSDFIDWPWSDGEFAQQCGDALCGQLHILEADPAIRAVLVVTHVPLFEAQMCRQPERPQWAFTNAYFGNMTLGQRVAAFPKVWAVVSGHTHIGREGFAEHLPHPSALPPISVRVLASDYNHPTFVMIDTADWK